ncbi:unnamed protein product, partial [marine sediment metagenome]
MPNIELEDLVYTYPNNKEPGFQTLISAKEEFRETISTMSEPVPKRGERFKQQEYLLRLMKQFDEQLVVWRTGTGKSCGVISVTEHYKSLIGAMENFRNDPSTPYRHAYVLVKGPGLVQEFKYQLVCKCTDETYITDTVRKSTSESQRRNNLTRSINTFYTVTTYGSFAREASQYNDEQFKRKYNHSIFIIDEAHNLRSQDTGKTIIDPKTGNKIVVKQVKRGGILTDVVVEQKLIYDQVHRAF